MAIKRHQHPDALIPWRPHHVCFFSSLTTSINYEAAKSLVYPERLSAALYANEAIARMVKNARI